MSIFAPELLEAATELLALCRDRGLTLATAESCTGGLAAALLTSIAGSSDVVDRGFVTYSNASKQEMLGVPEELLSRHGAVSEEVARVMAEGALLHSKAKIAVSVTGIAGPGGGTTNKPVGRVHVACAGKGLATLHHRLDLAHLDRQTIRLASVAAMLDLARRQALGP